VDHALKSELNIRSMLDGTAGPSATGNEAVLANGSDGGVEQLNDDFRSILSRDRDSSDGLSPLKRTGNSAETPAAYSWRSNVPGDSPGTARASRRHRSQPFFIGVAGAPPCTALELVHLAASVLLMTARHISCDVA